MNTQENNKLIAEFMGFIPQENNHFQCYFGKINKILPPQHMEFHSDWNWLMEVVEKIESIGAVVTIGRMKTDIQYLHPIKSYINCDISIASGVKINHIYKACIDFVKWYNQQPK